VDLAQYFATTPRDGDDYSSTAAHYAREAVRVFGLSERLCVKYYGYLHLPDARGCVAEWVEDSLATIRKRRGA
jgi:hypothetical protein